MTTIARLTAAVLACTAAVALAACGEKTLDTADAEDEISDQLVAQGRPKPKAVECPDDMKAKKGEKYTCTLTAPAGDKAKVNLTMLDDDGKFRFEVVVP